MSCLTNSIITVDCSRREVWLAENNRHIQTEYIDLLKHKDIGNYSLSKVQPEVDSIILSIITEYPDFDRPDELKKEIETSTISFADEILAILN